MLSLILLAVYVTGTVALCVWVRKTQRVEEDKARAVLAWSKADRATRGPCPVQD